jgi:hypothetical protein
LLAELTACNDLIKQLAAIAELHDLHTRHTRMQNVTCTDQEAVVWVCMPTARNQQCAQERSPSANCCRHVHDGA